MTGAQLRAWRTGHGLTQPALAAGLGISVITVKRWEYDEPAIPGSILAYALGYLELRMAGKLPVGDTVSPATRQEP